MVASTAKLPQRHTVLPIDTQTRHYKWLVAAIVLVAEGTQTFAGNSINLAVPRLMADFGTDLTTTQWVATGFQITRTLVIPTLGWLGGILGNRNLFVMVMAGFVISTIGCGLAPSLAMLIGFRLLQGLALGPMEGITAVILVQAFPVQQRGLALGLRAIGWSAGQVISFTLGGYFIEEVSWRLIFFLGVPTGIIAAMLGLLLLPQQRDYQGVPVDYLGLLALGSFLVPLLLAISLARYSETAVSTVVLLGLGAIVGGSLFILQELLAPFPAVNLRLFGLPTFRAVCVTGFLDTLGLFGAQFMIPIFLQQVMGFTALQAGLIIVPAVIVSGVSGVITGRLSDMVPPPLMAICGLTALTIIFYAFSSVGVLTTVGVLVGYIILERVCMYAVFTPLTALTIQILHVSQVRMGQGLLGVVRNIGASLGLTVTSVFFERRRASHQLLAYDTYAAASPGHHAMMRELKLSLHEAGIIGPSADRMALGTIRQQMDIEAITAGFQDSFLLLSGFFLLASIPVLFIIGGWLKQGRGAGIGSKTYASIRS
ncbi:MAG: DHA2 family efflux MFS transporter permease subunit [Nitrospinae bacterium]|nr:DHA2 family efflux MFS transporter permease subunit [Nitrospinota bacterium]